ncbi:hypothetical protein AB0B01_24385 [Streptomyces sp. NPDC044571]|uniref:hypothetical protein n=1 Tax=Streptomyces sp. NPDC044571 TaxID=3155371 RepID=UPI003400DFF0
MHPTRTTTKLLLGVACAVSAVSGCVTVTPAPMQPAGGPGAAGAAPRHEPRGGPGATAVEVRAPALEALKAVPEQSGRPVSSAAPAGRPAAAQGTAGAAGTAAEGGGSEAVPPVPDIPEPRKPAGRAPAGRGGRHDPKEAGAEVPRELMRELPVRPADVCALGRRHGRWQPDSPEARICAGVHGG